MPEEIEFSEEEISILSDTLHSTGWKIYVLKVLKPKFDREYKKLRKSKKSDKAYDKINGLLDGIEFGMNALEETISEESQTGE